MEKYKQIEQTNGKTMEKYKTVDLNNNFVYRIGYNYFGIICLFRFNHG